MNDSRIDRLGRPLFASGLLAVAIVALACRDFALQWGPLPRWIPPGAPLAVASGVLLLVVGTLLLSARMVPAATRVTAIYLLLWLVVLKIPPIVASPRTEGTWLDAGMTAMFFSAGWILAAGAGEERGDPSRHPLTGERGQRLAQLLFGVAVLPVGISHFVYLDTTISLVPSWLPWRTFWACLTGAGQIAAGLGILFGVLRRAAAFAEAAMLTLFTVLVWIPAVRAGPHHPSNWSEFAISWAIAAAAWVVFASLGRNEAGIG